MQHKPGHVTRFIAEQTLEAKHDLGHGILFSGERDGTGAVRSESGL